MALNTFGWTPAEVTTDSAGNVVAGVTLTVFTDVTKTTQVTGLMDKDGVTPLANNVVVSDNKGRFGFKASDAYSLLYVYDGSTADPWPIAAHEALDAGMASHAQAVADAQAAADSAATSASNAQSAANLVGAPADTAIAAAVNGPTSSTRTALNAVVGAKRRDGAGGYTTGDVVEVGNYAFNKVANVGTSQVQGGAPNYENVIGGNVANVNTATSNLTGLPTLTGQNGNWDFILSGYDNVVNGWAVVCNGFHQKVNTDANHATVSGGSLHTVNASVAYGTIGGGTGNSVTGDRATVGGGASNTAASQGTVAGGNINAATGSNSSISGGNSNTASGNNGSVGGGTNNAASGVSSSVVGGQFNTASGVASTVSGRESIAYGDASHATGRGGIAIHPGERAHGGGNKFSYEGDALTTTLTLHQGTTTATAADMWTSASAPPVIPELSTWMVTADVVARRADAVGEYASWRVTFCVKRDVGNTTALVGTPTVTSIGASVGSTWALSVGVYSVGNVRLIVTGEASKTIRWVARLDAVQVQATPTAAWVASTAFNQGQRIVQSGAVLQCVTGGTTAATAPANPPRGGTVTDGTVVWLRTT